jgi:signal transduction histidine kinase
MNTFPKDLIDALASGEAVAVVGSGLSITAGLPSWPQLLEAMIKECDEHCVGFSDGNELRQMLAHGEFLPVADECVKKLGKSLYRDFLQRIFKNPSACPTETHRLLLDLPFSAILTTNYDTLLEQSVSRTKKKASPAPVYTHKNNAELERLAGNKSFFILKLHGHIDNVETVVLTYQNYRDIYRNEVYRRTLSTLLATRRLVFIGYGLRDPDLNYLLEEQNSIYKNFGQRHFAFVADPGKVLAGYFSERFNIEVLPYNSNRRHLQLQTLLQALGKAVRQEGRSRKTPEKRRKIELPLTKIRTLREIMSYEREFCEAYGGKIEVSRARFLKANARKAGFNTLDIKLIEKSIETQHIQLTSKKGKGKAGASANALAAFAQSNPNPIFQIMPDGAVRFHNEAAARLLDESGHANVEKLLPNNYRSVVLRCIQKNQTLQKHEGTLNERKLAWWFFADPSAKFVHCYAEDVTEWSKLEEQLRQSQKMESIGQLAGGIAHDFHNILTVILGHATLLIMQQLEPKALISARQIKQAAERAAGLTRQLLAFGRKQIFNPLPLDLNQVTKNMAEMLARLLGEDVVLKLNFSDQPAAVSADAGMLEQIILNLAVNSRDAMPRGGQVSISIEVCEVDEAHTRRITDAMQGKFIRLSYSDTGTGISPDILPRIFEPFFTTKDVGKGTGLGLATVFGIVKQHKGWVEVESELGQGATFYIYFPITNEVLTNFQFTEDLEPLALTGKGTILVVEDENALRALVVNTLKEGGYRVFQAVDGQNALQIWAEYKNDIDLVFTDIIMPGGLYGRELAERFLREKSSLRIVYSSGYSMDTMGLSSTMREGVNFLQKPYLPDTLLKIIHRTLNGG